MQNKFFLYFNVATCWKLFTMFISSQIDSRAKNWTYRVNQTWFRACLCKTSFFQYFNVATCWKLSTMLISSQIDSTAKIGHTECIKHDLELVYSKKKLFCISMLQLAENCSQFSFNLKYTAQQKLDIQSASNMI